MMPRSYSLDLRERVVAVVLGGATTRSSAARYGVSVATAVRWSQRGRAGLSLTPGKRGGPARARWSAMSRPGCAHGYARSRISPRGR